MRFNNRTQLVFLISRVFNRHCSTEVRWFYAADVPLKKPFESSYKPKLAPKKFIPFSHNDSERLERFYQLNKEYSLPISVNEDYLFEVSLNTRQLMPSYWEGPIYEVRRGEWFNSDNMPLDENLVREIENYILQCDEGHDLFKLEGDYEEGKYVLFVGDKKTEAILIPELYGGSLQLSLLRNNNFMPIGFSKVSKGYSEQRHGVLMKAALDLEHQVIGQTKHLGKISDMLNWEFLDLLYGSNKKILDEHADTVMKEEMEVDYRTNDEEEPATKPQSNYREVDHLVFCVHGIGQSLGKKYEYVNFAHTVNLLRNNLKQVYSKSDRLKQLNKNDALTKDWESNSRIQVLPITWRHHIGINTEDLDSTIDSTELPTLLDITVDGIRPLRKLFGDIALDVLIYTEEYYQDLIMRNVCDRLNRTFAKFCENNPSFNRKVSLIGHSLGSLILFDLLSKHDKYPLDFEVENFFTIGSPLGVFKLIQQTKIGSYTDSDTEPHSDLKVARPKCKELYNLFHSCDPIAYRMEPLIDKRFAQYRQHIIESATQNQFTVKVKELGDTFKYDANAELTKMPEALFKKIIKLNSFGRVDYSPEVKPWESDTLSAIKAHVSYFEEEDIADFLLECLLRIRSPVTEQFCKVEKK
ncbi:putative carboxylic ester hydrolase Ecym_5596 [Eremothecium cymbalariae DBVPG|uniref:DDHD domain-containing protein n=1 Tax=Eremothecium cymbalariae (strain CBS 270.75 / DBVPG 7215 / KCTC 17166 / NRRL Y-17582) TaxID=931890 RepID=I6NE41_ERECY|nr:hypothetical protein Ecym_5596 [Eremothecium cymbalariae DBVPG\